MTSVAVVGAGTMGSRIASLLGGAGHDVRVFDPLLAAPPEPLATSQEGTPYSVQPTLRDAVESAEVVFEAIIENLSAKRALFAQIASINSEATIASNTSTFLPSALGDGLNDPSRLLVAHFFHPADIVPLVELVPSSATDAACLDLVETLLSGAGKVVIRLNAEIDGFIANRLQAALNREAIHLRTLGIADARQIDLVVTQSIGLRWAVMGPFEVMDRGGLDVWATVLQRLAPELASGVTFLDPLLGFVEQGALGVKTGRGFLPSAEAVSATDKSVVLARVAEAARSSAQD